MVIKIGKQVAQVIELIRPTLESDGGNIELLRVDENRGVVHVRFMGECVRTPQALEILRSGVEEALKKEVPQVREVLTASSRI